MERVINVMGDIGSDITSKMFIEQLQAYGYSLPITVNINSNGGSLVDAFSIYDYLQTPSGKNYKFEANIVGMAASAATVIALACNAKIGENSGFLIHDAYYPEYDPNTGELVILETMNARLASIYNVHTGLEINRVRALMKAETFMDADGALELGFVKGINTQVRIAAKAVDQIAEWKLLIEDRTFTDYPESASNNARKALDWIEEYGRDIVDAGTEVGLARARQLANKEPISDDTVKRMASFNRHKQNSEVAPEFKDEPWKDKGYVAWLMWGGTSGVNWAIEKSNTITNFINLFKNADMDLVKLIKNTIQGIKEIKGSLIDGELEDGTKIRIESFGETIAIGDLVAVMTEGDGEVPAPDGEHTLSNGTTVIVTEGGKITEIKEKQVEAMNPKTDGMEAAFIMLAEELKAIRDELTTIKAAQGAPAPVAAAAPVARKVAPTVAAKAPAADPALDKTQKVNDGWNVLAKFAQKYGEQKHNLKFN
jgi:ATP-dependent protease ClpP protease subunit